MKYLLRRLLPVILFIGTLLCNVVAGASLGATFVDVVTDTNGIHAEASELVPDEIVAFRKLQVRVKQKSAHPNCGSTGIGESLTSPAKRPTPYFNSDSKQAVCFGLLFLQQLF